VPGNVRRSGFDVLTALAVAGALAPEDDAGAGVGLPPDTRVDSEYLTAVGAPFGWVEAERRAAECLKNGD